MSKWISPAEKNALAQDIKTDKYRYWIGYEVKTIRILNLTNDKQYVFIGDEEEQFDGLHIEAGQLLKLCLCYTIKKNLRKGPLDDLYITYFGKETHIPYLECDGDDKQFFVIVKKDTPVSRQDIIEKLQTETQVNFTLTARIYEDHGEFKKGEQHKVTTCDCTPGIKDKTSFFYTKYVFQEYPFSTCTKITL